MVQCGEWKLPFVGTLAIKWISLTRFNSGFALRAQFLGAREYSLVSALRELLFNSWSALYLSAGVQLPSFSEI